MADTFAVYQQEQGGAFIALPTSDARCEELLKVTQDFRSRGIAIVAKQALEREQRDGGADAA